MKLVLTYISETLFINNVPLQPTFNAVQVKEIIGGSLAAPTGSVEIWNDRRSGGRHDVRVMQLKAPSGYVCLGNVAVLGYNTVPDYSSYR